jgi:mono/diheme cytochrome c family protein
LRFPFSLRVLMWPWRWLHFREAPFRADPGRAPPVNRGAYLVEALAHCGECHTPRGWLGATSRDQWLAGARFGADSLAPNLTPHPSGLAAWSESDIAYLLEYGVTPEGDAMGGEMGEVIQNGTSKLTAEDRRAIAAYLKSVPPLPAAVERTSGR